MAELEVEGSELVVRLAWWERLAAHRKEVRVPVAQVARIVVLREPWRALRGRPEHALLIPDRVCVGDWRHLAGRDFVALRHHQAGVVCVELRPPTPYVRIAVGSEDPERVGEVLREAVGEEQ